jgi:hypothetical protein
MIKCYDCLIPRSFKRYRHDIQAINAMVERAEAVAAGKRALKKDRFVRITDAAPAVDWDLVKRAQNLAGGCPGFRGTSVAARDR